MLSSPIFDCLRVRREDITTVLPLYKKKIVQDQIQYCLCGQAEHDDNC